MPRILVISNIPTPYNDAFVAEVTLRRPAELYVASFARKERALSENDQAAMTQGTPILAPQGYVEIAHATPRGDMLGHRRHAA